MSLITKKFNGGLPVGAYKGVLVSATEEVTEDGTEYVKLIMNVVEPAITYSVNLFEKSYEWTVKDLSRKYLASSECNILDIIDRLNGSPVEFWVYDNEYQGKVFKRVSFHEMRPVATSEDIARALASSVAAIFD